MRLFRWLLGMLVSVGFGGLYLSATEPRLRVLVSLPALYSWASQVGGNRVQVDRLLPVEADPHLFQFRPRDLEVLRHTDVILLSGAGLEDWLKASLEKQLPGSSRKIVEMATGYPPSELIYPEGPEDSGSSKSMPAIPNGPPNPHLWLDPIFACHGVTNILRSFQQLAPDFSAVFSTNALVYIQQLHRLHDDYEAFRRSLKAPAIVTVHPAFPYLCRRYRIRLVGVLEETAGTEPGPRHLATLMGQIRENHISTLFVEPHSNSRLALQLARDMKLTVAELDTLETGYWSAAGYEEGMRSNLRTLMKQLQEQP
jgi:zinc transport system substrate-binding protein